MKKIALLAHDYNLNTVFSEKYYNWLRKNGELVIYSGDEASFADKERVLDFVKGANIIITSWGSPKIDEDILNVCPDLELVVHAAGTPKPIITDALIAKKVPVTNSAIALGEGVAETALGFAISACKHFYWLSNDTKNKLWKENSRKLKDFYDITVGVVSGGYVGRHMIKLLQNFNVDVLLYDPTMTAEQVAALGATKAELDEMISKSDIITIHAPAIPATEKMFNASNIPLIKDGAILINTSRGVVIDEPVLIEELKKNRFYACLDVTDPEPPALDNPLRDMDNVILTPHIAGAVTNGLKRIAKHVCEEIDRHMAGEPLRTPVNMDNLNKIA